MSSANSLNSPRTAALAQTPLFQVQLEDAPYHDQLQLSYERARAIAKLYRLSPRDVLTLSDKFWEMHMDHINTVDGATVTLLTIQLNLAAGTLAPFALKRPELRPLLQKILDFDIAAQYLLTEVGHGLDARNLETTATLLPSGEFDLHTPNAGAAKNMPPTCPYGGIPKMGIVIAKLIVDGEDRGVRGFIVALNDGMRMCKGVTARILPKRAGCRYVDHALTSFDHVRLPPSALLGELGMPADLRINFFITIWRVSVGTLALSALAVPTLAMCSTVAARYSLRRTVTGPSGEPLPIWSFRTQQLPVLHAIAQVFVFKAHAQDAIRMFKDSTLDPRVRLGVAAAAKASTVPTMLQSFYALSERCGAQGLFKHNQIVCGLLEMRGVAIAEGDVLALSIRLATELIAGRYELPESRYPDCLLAQHETGLLSVLRTSLVTLGGHRSTAFSRLVLPMCQPLVVAIGQRMAYEAALDAGVDSALLDLYEAGAIAVDPAWYAENVGLSRWAQAEREERAASAALPKLEEYVQSMNAERFATAPIATREQWDAFVNGLECVSGDAVVDLVETPRSRPSEGRIGDDYRASARL